jgi:hypothetical protein
MCQSINKFVRVEHQNGWIYLYETLYALHSQRNLVNGLFSAMQFNQGVAMLTG